MRCRSVVALILSVLLGTGAFADTQDTAPASWTGTFDWTMNNDRFGGMSAIEVDETGLGFVAVSDRGAIFDGTFLRGSDGRITGVDPGPLGVLRGRGDDALPHSRSDSEGLAIAPDGTVFVSFEIAPRVLRYQRLHGSASLLPIPRDFSRMESNGALEALAIAPDGALYTLPEVTFRDDGAFPVYRFKDGKWSQPFLLPRLDGFLPVGADFGPDGRLYLLERDFGARGLASRVRRFAFSPDGIDAGEILLQSAFGDHGNLEGISVWRDGQGRMQLTMIADDNFNALFRTSIVEYAIQD